MSQTTQTPVQAACQRLKDFMIVTASRPNTERAEAIGMFAQAAGLNGKQIRELRVEFEKATDNESAINWAIIGTIVGMFLADELR